MKIVIKVNEEEIKKAIEGYIKDYLNIHYSTTNIIVSDINLYLNEREHFEASFIIEG
uniref:Uncharacterized protein n=1 Tax=viral metagenome TaxID=1070528 RepID=A0A6H1ZSR0_9ZZZZ